MTTVTVCVPLTIRKRGGRKMIISPDGVATDARSRTPADTTITRGDPALVKALARAFRWRRMLETGAACSVSDIARQEKVEHVVCEPGVAADAAGAGHRGEYPGRATGAGDDVDCTDAGLSHLMGGATSPPVGLVNSRPFVLGSSV